MNNLTDLTDARVYVGTYKKYTEGSLFGKWLLLSDYISKEDFYEACHELHNDEDDPEFMFQDFENIPRSLIGESWMSDNLFDVINAISDMSNDQVEPFMIWLENGHHDISSEDINDLINSFESDYIGKYDDEEDYAYKLIEERDDLNDFAKQYFDYEAYAKDIFLEDHWFADGHVFAK